MINKSVLILAIIIFLQACGGSNDGETVTLPPGSVGPFYPDTDGDGIKDNKDQCANTEAGATIDVEGVWAGCSQSQKDDDGDSVANGLDLCPNTDSGLSVDTDGCADIQKDSDEDGVLNNADQCPGTLPSATDIDGQGCSAEQRDTDGDSVSDASDLCQSTPDTEQANGSGCSPSQTPPENAAVLTTDGVQVFDATGENFVMRGINLQYGDNEETRIQGIAPIAETGANVIRLQIREETTSEQLEDALDAIVDQNLVAMPMLWGREDDGITCANDAAVFSDYVKSLWLDKWRDVLIKEKYQAHLLINIANEWGPKDLYNSTDPDAYNAYFDTYGQIISYFRGVGFKVPLVIDAPHCGQDWHAFENGRGQALVDSDPEKNIIVSIHAYNFMWDSENEMLAGLNALKAANVPFIIGEFGYSELDNVDEAYLLDDAQNDGYGWVAWSWKGNGAADALFDMSKSENTIDLTARGEVIVNRAVSGITASSSLASFPESAGGQAPPAAFTATGAEATPNGDVEIRNGTSAYLKDFVGSDDDPSVGSDDNPSISWTFNLATAGRYEIQISYTSDHEKRAQNIAINGGDETTHIFPQSETVLSEVYDLTEGDQTLVISANWGHMEIHSITVTTSNE